MLTAFLIMMSVIGWGYLAFEINRHSRTIKLLEAVQKNIHSTPVKELVANFRDFVQGFDGQISPEVEAALKKLQQEEAPKALPPMSKTKTKPIMDATTWNLFCKDYSTAVYEDEKISIIKRWGKKFVFSLPKQVDLIKSMIYNDDRERLRDYFDKSHSNI